MEGLTWSEALATTGVSAHSVAGDTARQIAARATNEKEKETPRQALGYEAQPGASFFSLN